MDSNLVKAAISGDIEVLRQNKDKLGDQIVTETGNTVLHLAARSGKTECIEWVLSMHPSLLLKVNSRGNTALHLAANGGHASVVRALMDCVRALTRPPQALIDLDIESGGGDVGTSITKEMLIRMVNYDYDTALHEAVRYNRVDVVRMLTQEDPNYEQTTNNAGETPLYLAAHRGYHELVSLILRNCKSPTYYGPYFQTALHGAVISNNKECIEKLLEWKQSLLMKKDYYGWTALHLATHVGYTDIVCQLLSVDETVGYKSNSDKNTALHIAASLGHISILKEIISRCPNSWEVVNKKGQNMLHIAAEHKQKEVIEYILEDFPFISSLINQRDRDGGNTPLHLLASANCFVPKLIQHSMADKNAMNYDEQTPLNMAVEESDVAKGLKGVGAMCNYAKKHEKNEDKTQTLDEKEKLFKKTKKDEEEQEATKKVGETHVIVAALIATVAFTAGFTLPGGFNGNDGPNEGFAILTRAAAFKAFMITDTLALLCSTTALLIYFRASGYDKEEVWKFYASAAYLIIVAIGAMMVAFVTGTYAVLAHSPALAIATSICGCSFFIIYFWLLRGFFWILVSHLGIKMKQYCIVKFYKNR